MDILKGKIKPIYLRLLTASVGSAIVASIFSMVDAIMVGQYHGPNGTSALAVFNPVWSFVYSLGILAGIGGSVIFATLRGQNKERESNECFTASVIFGVILSIIAMLILGLLNEPLFRFFGADDELLHLAKQYLKPIFFAIPCCIFTNIQSAYLRNDGNANLAMFAVIFGGIFNAFGDYFFVFAMDMGILGAGLATAIGLYASNLIMLTHYFRKKNSLRFVKPNFLMRSIGKISKNGISTAVTDISMGILTILFNRQIVTYIGNDGLAVYGIIAQIVAFAQCCAYGVGQASQPIISQNYGAKQNDRIKLCFKYGLITCLCFAGFWTVLAESIPNVFIKLFMKPTDSVLAIAPNIIRTYGISMLLLPFNIYFTYYFQSIMKAKTSIIISILRGAIVSGIMIFVLPLIFGGNALWFAMPVTELIIFGASIFIIIKCNRKLVIIK